MAQSTMILTPVPLANVPTPPAGKYGFFLADGTDGGLTANGLYKIDSSRTATAMIPAAYTDENAQDAVGGILLNTTTITWNYDDGTPTVSANVSTEAIQDIIGAFVAVSGGLLSINYDDAGNALTVTLTSEVVQDLVGAMFSGTGLATVTYNDPAGTIVVDVSNEAVQDMIGTFLTAADGTITVTYNDAGNAMTIGVGTITSAKVSDFAAAAQTAIFTTNIAATTESVQDIVGAMVTDSSEIDATYNDAGATESLTLINNTIARARLVNPVQSVVLGRAAGAGTGVVTDLTDDQIMEILGEDTTVANRAITANIVASAVTTEQVLKAFSLPSTWNPPVGATYRVCLAGTGTQTAVGVTVTGKLRIGNAGAGTGGALLATFVITTPALARAVAEWRIEGLLTIRSTGAGGSAVGDIDHSGQLFGAAVMSTTLGSQTTTGAVNTTAAQDVIVTITLSATTLSAFTVKTAYIQRVA